MQILTQALMDTRLGTAELIRLTDDAHAGIVGVATLDQVVSDAEAKLLVNIGQKYVLPLTLANALDAAAVRAHCMAVAIYDLYVRRDKEASEDVAAAAKAAIAWSEKIGKDELGLLGETPVAQAPSSGSRIDMVGEDAVFSRDSMKGL